MAVNLGSAIDMLWDGGADEVRHTVVTDDGPVLCRISREAVEDDLGNPAAPEECLDAAQADFDRITDIWLLMIARGQFEADGTILIRSGDLPPRMSAT